MIDITGINKKFESISYKEFKLNYDLIQKHIDDNGFSFEGKDFPYSIKPVILTEKENNYFRYSSEILLDSLEIALAAYYNDKYIQKYFEYYEKFKELINIRPLKKIVTISRFDTVWYGGENYKIFEPNTCCPGGIAILGIVKDGYKNLPFIKRQFSNYEIIPFECDNVSGFINALIESYKSINQLPNKLNIAFCNYNGIYSYELKELKDYAIKMGLGAFICDLKDLKLKEGNLYTSSEQIHIVYSKSDPLMLEFDKLSDLKTAVENKTVSLVNSFPAMYIGESKLILGLLQDEYFQKKYLNEKHIEMINKHIPWTKKLMNIKTFYHEKEIDLLNYIRDNKNDFVIKVDNETRGANIFIGKDTSQEKWKELISTKQDSNWLVQEYCKIPTIRVPMLNNQGLDLPLKKFGLDFFMYNGKYTGVVSRLSEKNIINVGNGGSEQPVIVLKEKIQ